ncbi:hypothetical protein FSP39_017745 [Pinctada imbricata]|uniref:C1q domain-containing protein n=1 Tax=Pinctada imbricata TaxID=66713 RepID=A0AA89BQ34_PINIB|nr:hypothetical protein FSP39_017745 [Pinctada imbricata]
MVVGIRGVILLMWIILEVECQSLLKQNECGNNMGSKTADNGLSLEDIRQQFHKQMLSMKDEMMKMKDKQDQKLSELESRVSGQSNSMRLSDMNTQTLTKKVNQHLQKYNEDSRMLLNTTGLVEDISLRTDRCENKIINLKDDLRIMENKTRKNAAANLERTEEIRRMNSSIAVMRNNVIKLELDVDSIRTLELKVDNQNKSVTDLHVALKGLNDSNASLGVKFESRFVAINQTVTEAKVSLNKSNTDLQRLKESINHLTNQTTVSDSNLARQDTQLRNLENLTNQMLASMQRERENTGQMNGTIWGLENVIRSLQHDIVDSNEIERKLTNFERSIRESEVRMSSVNVTLQGLKLRCGFTAQLGNGTNIRAKRILPFRHVYSNIGNAYNISDFKFYAPVSGMYYFHVMVCSQKGRRATVHIMKGQTRHGFVYAEDQSNYDCAGNGVMAELTSGEAVWVAAAHYSRYDPNTFFTGFLARS